MKTSELEIQQRTNEWFHTLTIPTGMWIIIRVDGRSFSKLTADAFMKPFDHIFSQHMADTAQSLMTDFGASYAYTESDEISILLPQKFDMFGRSLEKLVSVSAGLASAEFSSLSGLTAHFDSRIWIGASSEDVLDYFSWRQTDAIRCGLNGWCYWTLRENGRSRSQATNEMKHRGFHEKIKLLLDHGVDVTDLPLWQFHGIGLFWETFKHAGFNPTTQSSVDVVRRRITVERSLQVRNEYRWFLMQKAL